MNISKPQAITGVVAAAVGAAVGAAIAGPAHAGVAAESASTSAATVDIATDQARSGTAVLPLEIVEVGDVAKSGPDEYCTLY